MNEPYYKPSDIFFRQEQVIWLIPYLPLLRSGTYPRNPAETGYTEAPINKRQVRAKAGFVNAAEVAAELDWRIQQTGDDGLFLEMVYSQPDDKYFVMQHIAVALRIDVNQVDKDIHTALAYITGWKRKTRSYIQWRQHKGSERDCRNCEFYKVLNPHHIIDNKPLKSCSYGEQPNKLCHYKGGERQNV